MSVHAVPASDGSVALREDLRMRSITGIRLSFLCLHLGRDAYALLIRCAVQVDLVSANGEAIGTLSSQWQTAISSRNVFSADGRALAAATASGRLHIYR